MPLPANRIRAMAARAYHSTIRAQAAAATRTAILDAAEELFHSYGYAPTSIAQIADAAGVAQNTVYVTFSGKAGLVVAMVERGANDPIIARTLDDVDRCDHGEAVIRLTATGTGSTVRRHLSTIEVVYDNVTADPVIADAARNLGTLQREQFRQIANRLVELGALREGLNKATVTDMLWFYFGPHSWRTLRRTGWSWQRCDRWLTEQAIAALLNDP